MTDDDLQERLADLEEALGATPPDGPTEIVITDRVVSTDGEDLGVFQRRRITWGAVDGWQSEELAVDAAEAAPGRGDR